MDISKVKVDTLKNTWNYFRDMYVRYKNESQTSSGSAVKVVDPPEHNETMQRHDDMLIKRRYQFKWQNCCVRIDIFVRFCCRQISTLANEEDDVNPKNGNFAKKFQRHLTSD